MTRQTPEESAMAIANSTDFFPNKEEEQAAIYIAQELAKLSTFIHSLNPSQTKAEAMKITAIVISNIPASLLEDSDALEQLKQIIQEEIVKRCHK